MPDTEAVTSTVRVADPPATEPPSTVEANLSAMDDRRLGLAALVAGLIGAVSLPVTGVGIGWGVAAVAAIVVVVMARGGARPAGPSLDRDRVWRYAAAVAAAALVAVAALRSAGWLVALCLAASVPLASYALAGGSSALELFRAGLALIPSSIRGFGAALGSTGGTSQHRPRVGRVITGLCVGVILALLFGALFRAADPAFADLLRRWQDAISVWSVVRALLGFVAVSGCAAGAVALMRQSRAGRAAAEPHGRAESRGEFFGDVGIAVWLIPVAMLDALFGVFVWIQVTVLFAGEKYVLGPGGPDYAVYARSGSAQLGVVAILTLAVVAAIAMWVRPRTPATQALLRAGGGILCGLTLVIVASALTRMSLYADAYGFTQPRLLAFAGIAWLGIVFLLVAVAGVRLKARWFPLAFVASAIGVLLALAVVNPEALMARTHIDRLTHDYPLDEYFLSHLSADAVDDLDKLPEPQRTCVLRRLRDELREPDPWYRWNVARSHARAVITSHQLAYPAGITEQCSYY